MMTYGWVMLLLSIFIVASVALGILDPGSIMGSSSSGFSQISPVGWSLDNTGLFRVMFNDGAGTSVNITSIQTTDNLLSCLNSSVNTQVPEGSDTPAMSVCSLGTQQSGSSYSLKININYTDNETGFAYTDSGTLTGRVI